jgi:hypothetical protein
MKILRVFLWLPALLAVSNPAFSQGSPDTLWTRIFDCSYLDMGKCVRQTSDGGFIIAGYGGNYYENAEDIYVIKTDGDGNEAWRKTFGGGMNDEAHAIEQTSDGGYVIIGTTASTVYGYDYYTYVIKTDSGGDKEWARALLRQSVGTAGHPTGDGGFIVAGFTTLDTAGSGDALLLKLDEQGSLTWSKTFGGTGWDDAFSVEETADGGYIIAGRTESTNPSGDIYLIKTDENGDESWSRVFGGAGIEIGYAVEQTPDGGYVVAGRTSSYGAGGDDVYVIKTDAGGDTLWTRTFGGENSDCGYDVEHTVDGGFIVVGDTWPSDSGTADDVYIIKLDSQGVMRWWRTIGGTAYATDRAYSVRQTDDGGYIIGGITLSMGSGDGDFYLIRLKGDPTSIDGPFGREPLVASSYLSAAYPNPFNPVTTITYRVAGVKGAAVGVRLKIYNASGQLVRTLVDGELPLGEYRAEWNGRDDSGEALGSGIYFCRFSAGSFAETKKLVLLK